MPGVTVVVPCYNEASRIDGDAFFGLCAVADVLFVDDGSTDATAARVTEIAARRPEHMAVVSLERNGGKGEAVRQGMRHALDAGADIVGYLDADLSTPVSEMVRLAGIIRDRGMDVVMGSRVALLGTDIERSAVRHYLGRVFATAASLILRAPVYDTQCGAKLFRRSPALVAALADPFLSRWAFDVELLGRLLTGADALPLASIIEVPLAEWKDVPGSKLHVGSMVVAARDMAKIAADIARRRSQKR